MRGFRPPPGRIGAIDVESFNTTYGAGFQAEDESPARARLRAWSRTAIDRRVARWLLCGMLELRRTEVYARWLDGLRDVRARARVLVRVERLAAGNPGDVKPVGEGVSEMRIDHGPGYRVYFKQQGHTVVVLLAGGDKRTQKTDIETALRLARNL